MAGREDCTISVLATLKKRKKIIWDRLGYHPSKEQEAFHDSEERDRLVAGGIQGGKSYSAAMEYVGTFYDGNGLCWLVGNDYKATRAEYKYIWESFQRLGILDNYTESISPGHIVALGGAINVYTKSAKDPRKLMAEAPGLIIMCEPAQQDFEIYWKCRERLAASRGKLIMPGTFEGSLGWFPELWELGQHPNEDGLRSFSIPTWSNLARFPGGRNDPEIIRQERRFPPDLFQERFGAVPCPPSGRVFTEFRSSIHVRDITDAIYPGATVLSQYTRSDGKIQKFYWDPLNDVYITNDPGYGGAYSLHAVQIMADTAYVIDEIYERDLVTQEIIDIAQRRPWWKKVNPVGIIDIWYGKQHHAQPSVIETWRTRAGIEMVGNKIGVEDGIERMKACLKPHPVTKKPQIFIAPHCTGVISEFGGCPNPFTGRPAVWSRRKDSAGNILEGKPEDRNNHGITDLIYFLVDKFGELTPAWGEKYEHTNYLEIVTGNVLTEHHAGTRRHQESYLEANYGR